ncbi:MAG: hypothetical protein PHG63_00860 [Candidatus Dojkabacteria bacterium]|nr:hypothetical protein [Candidatus Dojkabacteria bacterium]
MADAVSSQEPLVPAPNIPPSQGSDTSPVPASRRNLIIFVILLAILLLTMGGILVYVLTSDRWQSGGENGTNEPEENEDDTDEDDLLTCTYNGVTYEDGEGFPSTDGCNSCSCTDGEVVCTLMACEDLEEDGEDENSEGETDVSYQSQTLRCPLSANNSELHVASTVVYETEFPDGVVLTDARRGDTECRYLFDYNDSFLVLTYSYGEYHASDFDVSYVEISSEYYSDPMLIRFSGSETPTEFIYLYGRWEGSNTCTQGSCLPYIGDGQYLYKPGLVDYGMGYASVSKQNDREDVLEVFDYIVGHTRMSIVAD